MNFKSKEERDEFICKYFMLVPRVIDKFLSEPHRWFQKPKRDLYISSGYESLVKAADKFDEERGVRFETYASNYIRAWLTKLFYQEMHYENNTTFLGDLSYDKSIESAISESTSLRDKETGKVIYKIYTNFPFKGKRKQLFKARFIDELPLEDIASIVGYSTTNSVKIALTKLKKELKNKFNKGDNI